MEVGVTAREYERMRHVWGVRSEEINGSSKNRKSISKKVRSHGSREGEDSGRSTTTTKSRSVRVMHGCVSSSVRYI